MIDLTEAEIRRLWMGIVCAPTMTMEDILNWSYWRRHHQAVARKFHKMRQSTTLQL